MKYLVEAGNYSAEFETLGKAQDAYAEAMDRYVSGYLFEVGEDGSRRIKSSFDDSYDWYVLGGQEEYESELTWEDALAECGQGQNYEGCLKAGSEYCDFECPFRDELFK